MNKKLSINELKIITGGESITGSLINAITSGIKAVFDIGKSLGSSIRRLKEKKLCEVS